jgi:hypothetical protein
MISMGRTMLNLEGKRENARGFIRKNPRCTYMDIKRATKMKIERIYQNMKEAYTDAQVPFSPSLIERNKEEQKQDIIEFVRKNPNCTVSDIHREVGVNVIRLFGSIKRAFREAKIAYPMREMNRGVANPEIAARSRKFEREILSLFARLGRVTPHLKAPSGIIDFMFEQGNEKYIVEVKGFRGCKNITISQLKQLAKYMKELNCRKGILVCPKESFPKRKHGRNVYIDGLEIRIISEEDVRGRSIKEAIPYSLARIGASSDGELSVKR